MNIDRLGYNHDLWHISSDGEEQLISGEAGQCSLPTLSPSGVFLCYISYSDGLSSVEILHCESFEMRKVAELEGKVSALRWLDEDRLIVVVDGLHAANPPKFAPDSAIEIEWLNYKKDGRPGFVESTSDLLRIDIGGSKEVLRRFGQKITSLAVSEQYLAFVLEPSRSDSVYPTSELCTFDTDSHLTSVVWTTTWQIESIAITGASKHIMAIASEVDGATPPVPRLWHIDPLLGPQIVYEDLDLACENSVQGDSRPGGSSVLLRSVPGSDDVMFTATIEGDAALFVGSKSDLSPRRLTAPGWSVSDFSDQRNHEVVATLECVVSPLEVFRISCSPDDSNLTTAVTHFNSELLAQLDITGPEMIDVVAKDGLSLSGYLFRPEKTGEVPLLIRVHGGPHLCYGSGFDLETQIAIGRGMAVLLPNIRGSSGKGTEFRSLSVTEWGGMDYQDLVAFSDQLESDRSIDGSRQFIQGGSYGGFLTNWTLTKTGRFAAAISERSVSNLISKFGTSDNGFSTNKLEMGNADIFGESLKVLIDRSPLFRAPSISTPLLLIHGEMDYRCPIEQSEQLFVALRRTGKKVKLVRFPGESHQLAYFGRPDHRIERLFLIFAWWETYQ